MITVISNLPRGCGYLPAAPLVGERLRNELEMYYYSQPNPPTGMHNDFPSDPDLFLLKLPGKYHGYVVQWSDLTHEAQKALYKAGLVIRGGKIK